MNGLKKIGKNWLALRLEKQVIKLRAKNDFKIVAVAGSVGKTTTKLAIAKLLQDSLAVRFQEGNYNDRLTVPLVVFGQKEPSIYNIFAWAKIWVSNQLQLRKSYLYDVVVLELGSDGPGQIKDFAYLCPEIAVITAVTDEHMANFKTLDAVAAEELGVLDFARTSLVNTDNTDTQYLAGRSFDGYGMSGNYRIVSRQSAAEGQVLQLNLNGQELTVQTRLLGVQGTLPTLAAASVGQLLGLSQEQIVYGAGQIEPAAGRLQILKGLKNSTIIDDSYNASPIAVKAALDVLYAQPANQRIAILGSMNEMGELSPDMHKDVGAYCDPARLNLVVTIGQDAKQFLAPAAKARGCHVETFDSPYDAGRYVQRQLEDNAAVLVKGSQNGVFAEEAAKLLIDNPAESAKLVRQSSGWLAEKRRQFPRG